MIYRTDEREAFMREALREAALAFEEGNLPIGAVIVDDGEIVSRGRNYGVTGHFLQHAEMEAISRLPAAFQDRSQAAIFTTVEPCYLCFGAILVARIGHVFFAARDVHFGCNQILGAGRYERSRILTFEGGVLEGEAFDLLYRHSESHCRLLFGDQFESFLEQR
ncbi:MAG: nucleoside deaminase [Anaerolineae bacterium]